MAIVATNIITGGSNSTQSSYNTAACTPSANKLVFLCVATECSSSPNDATATGCSLTWTKVMSYKQPTGNRKITILRALGSSTSNGAITIAFSGQNQLHISWNVLEFAGMDKSGTNGSGAIVQTATNSDGSASTITVTLGAFSGNNAAFGYMVEVQGNAITPGSGFTEIGEVNVNGNREYESEYKATPDTTVDWSWAGNSECYAVAIEIKTEPVGGAFLLDFV